MRKPAEPSRRRSRRWRSTVRGAVTIGAGVLAVSMAALSAGAVAPSSVKVTALRTENLTDPIGIDAAKPLLSWQEEADGAGAPVAQAAYQVRAATSPDRLRKEAPDLWDSGRVASRAVSNIAYAGSPLTSREHVYWQVRVWDSHGAASPWSSTASFEMGLLGNSAWQARWIDNPDYGYFESDGKTVRPLPVFAKGFATSGGAIASARLYMTGLGMYSATVDGKPVGKAVLEPGQTTYADEVQYRTYDVTGLVEHGTNEVAIQTGSGTYQRVPSEGRFFFNGLKTAPVYGTPKVIAQLEITYADGTRQTIATDPSWRTALGDTTFSSWWSGEDFDASRLGADWQSDPAVLQTAGWTAARPVTLSPTTTPTATTPLVANPRPPVTVAGNIKPETIRPVGDGSYILDFGANRSGWPVISGSEKAGTTVKMIPSELVKADGSLNVSSTGASATRQIYFKYTFAGRGHETWHAQFTYEGFRYLRVDGLTHKPSPDMITQDVVTASNPQASTFTSSSTLLNDVHAITERAITSNMMSVMTDCPDREKGPYTGDNVQNIDALLTDFDMSAFEPQLVKNMATAQRKPGDESPGLIANIAPEFHRVAPDIFNDPVHGTIEYLDEVNWGGAVVIIPWRLYQEYGDTRTMSVYYPNMVKWMDYEARNKDAHDGKIPGLGDWNSADNSTPQQLAIQYGYHRAAETMSKIAGLLGKSADAAKYAALADSVKADFNDEFRHVSGSSVYYGSDSEASNALALDGGLVPPADRPAVLQSLVRSVATAGNGITAGSVALGPLFRSLHAGGRDDVIYDMVTNPDRLSYAFFVNTGHTTLAEGFNGSGSQNHHFLGEVDAWLVDGLAGISQAPGSTGWSHIAISPAFVDGLTHASGSHDTPYGTVSTSWSRDGGRTTVSVTIPPGPAATLTLPAGARTVKSPAGAPPPSIRHDGDTSRAELGSGGYTFAVGD